MAKSKAKGVEALVIVHLSSLDAYTADRGFDEGEALALNISQAILEHDGPVIVVDQGWPFYGRESRPRQLVLSEIEPRSDKILWIGFDEAEEDWGPFLSRLKTMLDDFGVTDVVVGGLWFNPTLRSGCASTVYAYLKKRYRAKADPYILGYE